MSSQRRNGAVSETIKGDGWDRAITDEEFADLKKVAGQISQDVSHNVWRRRFYSDNTRFCRWSGQAPDGRKHAEYMDGEPAFPFEGASDARVRMADGIINEQAELLVSSAMAQVLNVNPMEANDVEMTSRVRTLVKYLFQNQPDDGLLRDEIMKLCQFMLGDCPGAAVLQIDWERNIQLSYETLTPQTFAQVIIQKYGQENISQTDLVDLANMISSEGRIKEASMVMRSIFPNIKRHRAAQMIREMREYGETKFPVPKQVYNGLMIQALRVMEDVFFTQNASSIQRSRMIVRREWLTESELRERIHTAGYERSFVQDALNYEGKSGFEDLYSDYYIEGDYSDGTSLNQSRGSVNRAGQFEVCTAYERLINDDEVPGIYLTPFHMYVDEPAIDRKLFKYKHGMYPFVYFPREVLGNNMLETRGIPELIMTDQESFKRKYDAIDDNVQLTVVPPLKVPRNRPRLQLVLGPMAQIKENRKGEIDWMEPPPFPDRAYDHMEEVRRRVDEYVGRENEKVPPVITMTKKQGMVNAFNERMGQAIQMGLSVAEEYLDDDEIIRILGTQKIDLAAFRETISSKYDLSYFFDVRFMDVNYIVQVAKALQEMILPMDQQGSIMRNRLVSWLMRGLDANLADHVLQPVEQANMKEATDEMVNFAMIAAGIEPPMMEDGQNFSFRYSVLDNILKNYPEAVEKMTPDSRKYLERRIKHLEFQRQQNINAMTGRVGVAPEE